MDDSDDIICLEEIDRKTTTESSDARLPLGAHRISAELGRSFSQQEFPACSSDAATESHTSLSQIPCTSDEVINENECKKRAKTRVPPSLLDEFFGVYCLISRSPNKYFKNRCYIGYTVNPNRRIRQHNAGKEFGGAKKTDHRGPWDMVCIIHGFPNNVSALRFEWAWQNPEKSRRLRALNLKKKPKESAFQFRLRIACHMLSSDPWRRLSLTFRWLLPVNICNFIFIEVWALGRPTTLEVLWMCWKSKHYTEIMDVLGIQANITQRYVIRNGTSTK
ncbi:unnamed protein product [Gongylonema pulchrum]|uniref:GIY-YIG domain-containing protein n=1 Tax=Gongylonema pulchrum TaxID=637853 RepID=A0A183DX92_9BILA|nr:unnamed protein product [Gongylonema pulchrum]